VHTMRARPGPSGRRSFQMTRSQLAEEPSMVSKPSVLQMALLRATNTKCQHADQAVASCTASKLDSFGYGASVTLPGQGSTQVYEATEKIMRQTKTSMHARALVHCCAAANAFTIHFGSFAAATWLQAPEQTKSAQHRNS
jgi:hypothetical protein